jgi:predicted nucleic-acid-binding protein
VIGLDTNIIVRYLALDDPTQSPLATDLIENRLTEQNPGFISTVVIAETVWVLQRAYRLHATQIVEAISRLLQVDTLSVQSEQEVFIAMTAVKDCRGTFADALIGALAAKAGCSHTATFDRKALRLPGFKAP